MEMECRNFLVKIDNSTGKFGMWSTRNLVCTHASPTLSWLLVKYITTTPIAYHAAAAFCSVNSPLELNENMSTEGFLHGTLFGSLLCIFGGNFVIKLAPWNWGGILGGVPPNRNIFPPIRLLSLGIAEVYILTRCTNSRMMRAFSSLMLNTRLHRKGWRAIFYD